MPNAAPRTGYAPVNGLDLYYEHMADAIVALIGHLGLARAAGPLVLP
jgi:hypothetical protein